MIVTIEIFGDQDRTYHDPWGPKLHNWIPR